MLDIVTVNWNAGNQLKDCIESILSCNSKSISRIIVVDNGSTDGSLALVEGLPGVEVIRTEMNLGFAAACNIGAKAGNAPYILFLNPDTRLEQNSISEPLDFMERRENAEVGVCGIQLLDDSGEVTRTCARFPTTGRFVASALGLDRLAGLQRQGVHMRDWDHRVSRKVDHVIGAFYMIRRTVFETLGAFDEVFFVYLEDVDLSYRVNRAGWDSWYLANVRAFHVGGGTSRQVKAKRLFYSVRSRLLYAFKHFPTWQAWWLIVVAGLVEPFIRTGWCIFRRDAAGVRETWSAVYMLLRSMPRIVRGEGRCDP